MASTFAGLMFEAPKIDVASIGFHTGLDHFLGEEIRDRDRIVVIENFVDEHLGNSRSVRVASQRRSRSLRAPCSSARAFQAPGTHATDSLTVANLFSTVPFATGRPTGLMLQSICSRFCGDFSACRLSSSALSC